MANYYALYERPIAATVRLPQVEAYGDVAAIGLSFIPNAALAVGIPQSIGDSEVKASGLDWSSADQLEMPLPSSVADATHTAAGLPFTASASMDVNVPSSSADATVEAAGLDWVSNAAIDVNIVQSSADAVIEAAGLPFAAIDPNAINLTQAQSYTDVKAGELPWVSQDSTDTALPANAADATVQSSGLAFVATSGAEVNLIQSAGDSRVQAAGLPFSASAGSEVNIPSSAGDATTSVNGILWTSKGVSETNLLQSSADATHQAVGIPWASNSATQVSLVQSAAASVVEASGTPWTSKSVSEVNLIQSTADATHSVSGLPFVTEQASEVNIPSSSADATTVVAGLDWTSKSATEVNVVQSSADATHRASGIPFVAGVANAIGLPQASADATTEANGLSFTTSTATSISLLQSAADATVSAAGLPWESQGGALPTNATCFDGSIGSPSYLATSNIPGTYNGGATTGYLSIWYKYVGSDPLVDTTFPNIIFTIWGDVEGDRLEMGVIAGDVYNADLFIETSSASGNSRVIGVTTSEIMDGNWHHLIFGSTGSSWFFFLDDARLTNTFVDFGVNSGEWFADVQGAGDHEVTVGATRVSGANNGTDYLHACLDEAMLVNNRNYITHSQDPPYLYNNGDGVKIPQVEAENYTGLWNDVFNAWEFDSGDIGGEYVDGIYNFTTIVGVVGTDGIPGKAPGLLALDIGQGTGRAGLQVTYASKAIPTHSGAFTAAAWCRFDSLPAAVDGGVVNKLYNGLQEWALWFDASYGTNGAFRGYTWRDGGQGFAYMPSMTLQTNVWYLAVLRIETGVSGLQVVVGPENGSLQYGTAGSASTVSDSTSDVLIGMYGYNTQPWPGAIDDVMYWTRRLADFDLDELFAGGAGKPYANWSASLRTGLCMHFSNDEASGTRFDSYGINIGTDNKYFEANPIPGSEPATTIGKIQDV